MYRVGIGNVMSAPFERYCDALATAKAFIASNPTIYVHSVWYNEGVKQSGWTLCGTNKGKITA